MQEISDFWETILKTSLPEFFLSLTYISDSGSVSVSEETPSTHPTLPTLSTLSTLPAEV